MANEISGRQLPQSIVQALRCAEITPNAHSFSLGVGFAQQAADVQPFVWRIEMKINLRHGQSDWRYLALAFERAFAVVGAAWLIKYCSNNATGRPVAPFAAPPFHAVPAMSKWAHGYF